MKTTIRITMAFMFSFLITSDAFAQVPGWLSPQSGSTTDNIVEVQWGDGKGKDDWEIGLRNKDSKKHTVTENDYDWVSGEVAPFTLTLSPSSGLVTYTLNGVSVSHTYDDYAGKGLDEIHIIAKTDKNAKDDKWTCEISNLTANGTAVPGGAISDSDDGKGGQWITGTINNLNDGSGQNITVTGNITYTWEGKEPKGKNMEMLFYLGEAYNPVEPTGLTLTSPNGGELWYKKTKQTISWTSSNIKEVRIYLSTDGGENWEKIKDKVKASDGSYEWEVNFDDEKGKKGDDKDEIESSETCLIRIEDKKHSDVFAISAAVFTITEEPEIKIEKPKGKEQWDAGSEQEIKWKSEGIETVTIEYSTDGGSSWQPVAVVPAYPREYTWTVPNVASEDCYVRVSGAGVTSDLKKDPFTILPFPEVTLISPNGGENWTAGTVQDITWTSQNVETLLLEFSTDGSTWTTIEESVGAESGLYQWTVTDTPSANCLIRLTDTEDSNFTDTSNGSFSVLPEPAVTLLSPNGGESWTAGSQQTVTWTSQNVSLVNIDYTTDSVGWLSIAAGVNAATGSITWTLPDITSLETSVRITSTDDETVTDWSDAFFTIEPAPELILTSPNGDETLTAGTEVNISWTATNVPTVTIEFAADGSSFEPIATDIDAATLTYAWQVPNEPTENALIRITGAGITDTSDAAFTILAEPSLNLTAPNGGESWTAGTQQAITWTATNNRVLDIEYSIDSGSNWILIIDKVKALDDSYIWTIPDSPSTTVLVRITGGNLTDTSDAAFSIASAPTLTLTAPNGGESLIAGTLTNITWTATNVSLVTIETIADGVVTTIAENIDATLGTFSWTIPAEPSDNYLIRITSINPNIVDESDAVFSIALPPSVTVTAPNGGESWTEDTEQTISWNSENIDEVTIEFSTDGSNWTLIDENVTASTGTYAWTIPATVTSTGLVRISGDGATDSSDAAFSILAAPSITLVGPNGGEELTAGSQETITWTATNVASTLIEYSTDGTNWITIASDIQSGTTSYVWTVPAAPSTTVTLRISGSGASDTSDAAFTIVQPATLTLIAPNGGESWVEGSIQNIQWSGANLGLINIDYTTDGVTWNSVVQGTQGTAGTFAWTVPGTLSTSYQIRVQDATDAGIFDISDATFTIFAQPTITVTAPNGGEILISGTTTSINWTAVNIGFVTIETVSGGTTTTLAENVDATLGTFSWTVPSEPSADYLIRITSADPLIVDESDAVFSIELPPEVTLTAPNGGGSYTVGAPLDITWSSTNVANIRIEFTSDGTTWSDVVASTDAAAGSFSWIIPANESTGCSIRISDATNSQVTDQSDAAFTITSAPTLLVTSPNGGENWTEGTEQTITWNSSGIDLVTIEFSTDGANWTLIDENVTASIGTIAWTLPATITSTGIVQISGDGVTDTSDGAFSILEAPSITLLGPNGGEELTAGSQQTITWIATNVASTLIEYSTDGINWTTIAANIQSGTTSYVWTVPAAPSTSVTLRVGGSGVSDTSDAAFTILQPATLTLITPNGGEGWMMGSTQNIEWSGANLGLINIDYTTDGIAWQPVAENIQGAAGTYPWTVPGTLSTLCQIRILDAADPGISDTSDGTFSIVAQPTITVISPNGGEFLTLNDSVTITWSASGVANVDIEFSNDGVTWNPVAENVAASTGSQQWQAPGPTSAQCLIRIFETGNPALIDQSDSYFSILNIPAANIINIETGVTYEVLSVAVAECLPQQTLEFRQSGDYISQMILLSKAQMKLRTAPGVEVSLNGNYSDFCLRVTAPGVSVDNITVYNTKKYGIWADADFTTLTNISSKSYISKHVIYAESVSNLTLDGISLEDCGDSALYLKELTNVTVLNVTTPTFSGVKDGILLEDCSGAYLENLSIGSDWEDDLLIMNSNFVTVVNSKFYKARHGIHIKDSPGVTLENCDVLFAWKESVHIHNSPGTTYTGGTITAANKAIFVDSSDNVVLSNVTVTSQILPTVLAFHLKNSANTRISGCLAENVLIHGINLDRAPNTYIDHTILRNTRYGIYISENSHGSTVINNSITNIRSSAVYIGGALENITIRNNIIVNSGWDETRWGIQCQNNNHPGLSITYNNVWNNREQYKNCAPGIGEISANPLFVTEITDLHLQQGSPSIDAGDPTDPVGAEPFDNGGRINQGAYGGTSEAQQTTTQLITIAEAAANGWVGLYSYTWEGMQYTPHSALGSSQVPAWSGIWVIVYRNLDILFPPDQSQGPAPASMEYIIDRDQYHLISTPLQPAEPEINKVFGDDLGEDLHDGSEWQFWRTSKYNYLTEEYNRYTGVGSIDTILAGRGYWMFHVYPIPMILTVEGTPVSSTEYTEFKLPVEDNGGTFHMVGNPFHYAFDWNTVRVRIPMTDSNPLGKIAANTTPTSMDDIDSWHIDLGISDPTGTFYDTNNRAGVVESGDDFSAMLSAIDLFPVTPDYIRLTMKGVDEDDVKEHSYVYQAPGMNEYVWEIELTTSFSAIDINLDLSNFDDIPFHYTKSIVLPGGAELDIVDDTTIPVTLSNIEARNLQLIVRRKEPVKIVTDAPSEFAISGVSPNPFNPTTTLTFAMQKDGNVRARVYNLNGQVVDRLFDNFMPAGRHSYVWNAKGHASGVYIVLLESNGLRATQKITLLK